MLKKLFIYLLLAMTCSSISLFADSAPSMNMNTNSGNSDAILKMNKVKIVKSAQASFFQTLGYTGGYCGLQESTNKDIFIFSLWDYDTSKSIHAQADYWSPITESSRFGGEGDGAKTMARYSWKLNTYYNIVIRAWKSNGRIYQSAFIQDTSNDKWFHTSTLSNIQTSSWLGGNANSFIENWTSNGEYPRKVFYKDFYTLSPAGKWSKSTGCSVSANSGQADINRNGIYHNSFNAYYDDSEDAFCMEHGKGVTPGSNFNGGRTANLGLQKSQANLPTLTVGEVSEISVENSKGVTKINWKINEYKSPQFCTKLEVKNQNGITVFEKLDTLPQMRQFIFEKLLDAGKYTATLSMTDIFNQKAETVTSSFDVSESKYLRVSTNKISLSMTASENKKFEIASNTNWSITNNNDWITLNKVSGSNFDTIQITSTDNPDTTKLRTAQLIIKSSDAASQTIDIIQKKNEVWYILFNQRGWSTGNPIMTNALTGTKLGVELTAHAPQASNFHQHWKIEYDKDGKYMQLINRVTGLSIDAACKANNPEDGYMWYLQKATGSKQFPGYRIISKNGQIGIHAQNSRVFPYNYEVAECFWYLVKPEEIYDYPTKPIEYSAGDKQIWYKIYTPGRSKNNYLTDNEVGESLIGTEFDEYNQAQMWKIINYENGNVQIISRKNKAHIQVPAIANSYVKLGTKEQIWNLNYIGEEQYRIQSGTMQLNLTAASKVSGIAGTKLGDSASWKFEKVTENNVSVNSIYDTNYHIFVKDSRIITPKTTDKVQVFNLAGIQMQTNNKLDKGIYVVKIGNVAQKILVD